MRIADCNWMDVAAYLRRDDRCVIPFGSTEQHAQLSLCVDAILAERSTAIAAAQVRGALYQLWNLIETAGCSAMICCASAPTGALPPWPLTSRMRRKPARATLSIRSRATASSVSTRSETLPGKDAK